jgi:hypothetical protein
LGIGNGGLGMGDWEFPAIIKKINIKINSQLPIAKIPKLWVEVIQERRTIICGNYH